MRLFDNAEIRELLQSSQIGLWRVEFGQDIEPRFYADSVMDELLGISSEVSPEERFLLHSRCIHPEDREMFQQYSNKLTEERAEVVYRYIHPDKGEMYVRCGGMRDLTVTSHICLKGTHQDISDTIRLEKDKIAEQRLSEENQALEKQLNIIQTLAKTYNSIYYVDMSNRSFVELGAQLKGVHGIIGESGDAVLAFHRMCEQIIVPEQRNEMRSFSDLSTIDERMKGKIWISKQFKGNLGGWSEGIFIAAKRDECGMIQNLIWATRSIDEEKRKELAYQDALRAATQAAQAANEAKSAFLFNMSHDIRTPMNAIIGYTKLMELNRRDEDKCVDYLEKIRKSGDFLLGLINNVLEMARIESGKMVLDEQPCSICQIFSETAAVYSELMVEKKIKFSMVFDVRTDHVFCDEVKVKEIFLNIISNAYKYTPEEGSITLTIEEIPSGREDYIWTRTIIQDTGIGMSAEYLPKLFDEFSREQSYTENKIVGTGLGMPIVKKLVELMGGTVKAESELGKGSVFTVILPHRVAAQVSTVPMNAGLMDPERFIGRRILLAEDNELNAEIATEILEEAGLLVEHAEDGVQCIDMMAKANAGYYDLILMDIQMPNMDGYRATQSIRQFEEAEKAEIPIIAMTANAFEEDKKNALAAGMDAHLSKPIDFEKLMSTLAMYLDRH